MVFNSIFLYVGVWHKGLFSLGVTELFQLFQKLVWAEVFGMSER